MMAAGDKKQTVYEGRRDYLSRQRMSWMAGRAADDLRLTGLHWRILAHVGRQNAERGWIRLSQSELAETWDVHRKSIGRCIGELVAWLYIEKRAQAETHESHCHYRTLMDSDDGIRSRPRQPADPDQPDQGECHMDAAPPSDTGEEGVPHTCGTRAASHEAPVPHPMRHQYTDTPNIADQKVPPDPPSRGAQVDLRRIEGVGTPVEELLAMDLGAHSVSSETVISRLLVPVLVDKRCTVELRSYAVLADVGRRAAGLTEAELDATARRLLARKGKLRAEHVRAEIDAARRHGAMVVIRPGTPQWHRWREHYAATGNSLEASLMERHGSWTVPSEWPSPLVVPGDSPAGSRPAPQSARVDTPSASRPPRAVSADPSTHPTLLAAGSAERSREEQKP